MILALWILAAVFSALTSLSLIDGMNTVRVTRITGPIQMGIVGAFLVILTVLCNRIRDRAQPKYEAGIFLRRTRLPRPKPEQNSASGDDAGRR